MKNQTESNSDAPYEQWINEQGSLSEEDQLAEAYRLIQQKKEVDVDTAYVAVKNRIQKKKLVVRIYQHINRYAAILLLPLLLIAAWSLIENFNQSHSNDYSQSVQQIECPVGIRSQVSLPDGTQVWLNSGSSIKYNLPFNTPNRQVELHGEAFLDVAKMNGSSFSIFSGNVHVEVLGTQFNFKSYQEDERIEVSLVEGEIKLRVGTDKNEIKKATLVPGDHLSYNKNDHSTALVNNDLENKIAWKSGRLVFSDTPLAEVAVEMERWYGVDVEIADQDLLAYKYTTTIENESLLQVIELLELSSSLAVEYQPKSRSSSNRAKVIFKKN
jgi:ferric-dicitrate binding protein FerR (iron transport regulator)